MKNIDHNYLPGQYEDTNELPINHNYLQQQFKNSEKIFKEIKELVMKGDFTLGNAVNELEEEFKKINVENYYKIFLKLLGSNLIAPYNSLL